MAVEADLRVVAELRDQGGDPVTGLFHDEGAGGVDDVHALAARVGHDAGLPGQHLRRPAVRHHEEPDGLQAEFAGEAEVLDGDVRLGAVGGDPADRGAVVRGLADVVLEAETRQHQEGDLRPAGGLHRGLDELLLRGVAEAVVEGGPAEAVAVRDLDDGHARVVECADDGGDVVDGELVLLGVGSVPEGRVGDPDVQVGAVGHGSCSPR